MIATIATILALAPALVTVGAVLLLVPMVMAWHVADATRPVDGPAMPGWALALLDALDDEETASALDWPILTPRTPEDGVRPMRRWVGRPWTPVRYPARRGRAGQRGERPVGRHTCRTDRPVGTHVGYARTVPRCGRDPPAPRAAG